MQHKLYILMIFTLIFFALPPSHARADDDAPAEETSSPPLTIDPPHGKVNLNSLGYFERLNGFPNQSHRLDLELEERANKDKINAKLLPWVWAKSPNAVAGNYKSVGTYFEIKEGWIEWTSDEFDIRAGNQIISWGSADSINPTDQWNARDITDILQSYKLPQETLRTMIHPTAFPDFTLELLYSPFFRANQLPVDLPEGKENTITKTDSRWLTVLPTKLEVSSFQTELYYKIIEPTYPSTHQFATRLQAMRLLDWDFSVSYFNGVEKTPRMSFTKKGNASSPSLPLTLTLLPSFHRVQVYGLDGAGNIEVSKDLNFGTRFEVAYNKRSNTRAYQADPAFQADLIKDDFIQGVLGLDYTIPGNVFGTVMYFNLMNVIYKRVGHREEASAGTTVVEGLPSVDPWDQDSILYFENRIQGDFKISNMLLHSWKNGDGILHPAFHFPIIEGMKADVFSDIFYGKNGFYGQFTNNNRYGLEASYAF